MGPVVCHILATDFDLSIFVVLNLYLFFVCVGIVIKVKATVTCEVKCFWVTDLNAALWCHVGNNSVNDLARLVAYKLASSS